MIKKLLIILAIFGGLTAPYFDVQAATPPAVRTEAADFISSGSVVVHASITTTRGSGTVYYWFEIGTDEDVLNNTVGYQQIYSKGTGVPVAAVVDNLLPNTTYYFRGAAQSDGGTAYGAVLSFITGEAPAIVPTPTNTGGSVTGPVTGNENRPKGTLPGIKTEPAGLVSANTGVIYAIVDPNGTDVEVWFDWGMSSDALSNQAGYIKYVKQPSNGIPWASILSELQPNSQYFFRAVAKNVYGTVYGNILSFRTTGSNTSSPSNTFTNFLERITFGKSRQGPASVATQPAGFVTTNTSVLYLVVNPNGKDVEVWFDWGTGADRLLNQSGYIKFVGQANGLPWAAILQGLNPKTTYYYRAAVKTDAGISYGDVLSFTTSGPASISGNTMSPQGSKQGSGRSTSTRLPGVDTQQAGFVTTNSAVLYLVVDPNDTDVEVWFEWGTGANNLPNQAGYIKYANQPSNGIPWGFILGDLNPGTTYYFRAVARNGNGTVRGDVLSFATQGQPRTSEAAPSSARIGFIELLRRFFRFGSR